MKDKIVTFFNKPKNKKRLIILSIFFFISHIIMVFYEYADFWEGRAIVRKFDVFFTIWFISMLILIRKKKKWFTIFCLIAIIIVLERKTSGV